MRAATNVAALFPLVRFQLTVYRMAGNQIELESSHQLMRFATRVINSPLNERHTPVDKVGQAERKWRLGLAVR